MGQNFEQVLTSGLTTLLSAGNVQGAVSLAQALHLGAMKGHVDYKTKTMTVEWEQANPQVAPVLMAEGFTIIPD